jgi:hypothetical protein
MGHHTTHSGKDWRFKSMSSEGEEDDARPAADRIATPRSDCVMESRLRNIGDQTFVATQSLGWTKDRIVKKRSRQFSHGDRSPRRLIVSTLFCARLPPRLLSARVSSGEPRACARGGSIPSGDGATLFFLATTANALVSVRANGAAHARRFGSPSPAALARPLRLPRLRDRLETLSEDARNEGVPCSVPLENAE